MESTDHVEGRKGWSEGMPAIPRAYFPTHAEAVSAMDSHPCAFRVYHNTAGKFEIGAMGSYLVITRAKKSAPWCDTGRRLLATCAADAQDQSNADSLGAFERVVSDREWRAIQVRQHLRAIGIKSVRNEVPSWSHLAKTNRS